MVNRKFCMGTLAMVLAFGIMVVGCDNGTTSGNDISNVIIPSPWAGQYTGGGDTLNLNANGTMSWTVQGTSGSIDGVIIETGGTGTLAGQSGTWVYITTTKANTINVGTAVTIPAGRVGIILQHALGVSIGTGQAGANNLLNNPQLAGVTWNPQPDTSRFPTAFFFGGDK